MDNFTFHNPVKLIFGEGKMDSLTEEMPKYGNKVLLLYGGGSIKQNGIYDRIIEKLNDINSDITEFAGIEANPKLSTVREAIDVCKKEQIDILLAVGGGSVIDAAKAIAVGAKTETDIWDIITQKGKATGSLPIGTIVTIASAGSEMNASSVITNWETKEKKGWATPNAYPTFSILDPALTYSVPNKQTVFGIVDVMAHVLENYFHHTSNTAVQDGLAESILREMLDIGPLLLENPGSYELRESVMLSAVLARNGMVNMGYKGDWATHDIEHAISAIHDIPHAAGIAVLFPNWMKHVLHKDNAGRFMQLAVRVFHVDPEDKSEREAALEGIHKLREFWKTLGAPVSLKEYGISEDELDEIADKTVQVRPEFGNFEKLTRQDSIDIMKASL
ncbi:NADH-dependent alcohol dehydrogenase [Lentibacillus kapialis]|uniref:NADH-dependent alcohol dehydrogenase n=1 Tax=Lentibacillus kapialis TaxID=340214 RepID=A0A917USU4_9BACI|nr:iron-containing alcohol dehydrogenase [Lentibacillus kapialis]GGJ82591.1 NADH-dependent alcohol dehydrogenase [Lentibacillus kapialis]